MSTALTDATTADAVALMLLSLTEDSTGVATLLAGKTTHELIHIAAFLARYGALRAAESDDNRGVDTTSLLRSVALRLSRP